MIIQTCAFKSFFNIRRKLFMTFQSLSNRLWCGMINATTKQGTKIFFTLVSGRVMDGNHVLSFFIRFPSLAVNFHLLFVCLFGFSCLFFPFLLTIRNEYKLYRINYDGKISQLKVKHPNTPVTANTRWNFLAIGNKMKKPNINRDRKSLRF